MKIESDVYSLVRLPERGIILIIRQNQIVVLRDYRIVRHINL